MKYIYVWGIRLATSLALAMFFYRGVKEWMHAPTLTLTLVLVGELITLSIYLAARQSWNKTSFRPVAVISTLVATFFFYLVVLGSGVALVPIFLSASLQVAGILWQIYAKISLGRSFGLLPANRGVVTNGAYKIVRHPIYLGYAAGHLGFLLGSFGWRNFWLFCALWFFQALRIVEEEKLLCQDEQYLKYMQRTKYRFIPGII
ncbi:protein-S-isoprenylcysteine O-methyltransferase Ste14 [Xanthomonas arboricola]|uniref:methyltransferase family protein n=1 Tax=Xanthomonas arboricola TaxID=56448 RepID=UPI00141B00AA|nr:methyltransferase [Xanthomonas arboricola]NIK34028.1 protein-S-isoprenylcysteine O-methyltransferase Ste14 [Xanthomonas arboricola]